VADTNDLGLARKQLQSRRRSTGTFPAAEFLAWPNESV